MSVTITACANSTPPAGTVIATCSIGGEQYQLFIQTDAAGNTIGVSGSPLFASVTNQISASISNNLTASAIQSGAWAVTASIANSPSVVVSSGSVVVTNSPSVVVSSGSLIVTSGSVIVNTAVASPVYSRITDGTDTAAVDSASRLLVSASLTDGLTVSSASVTVVNNSTACVLYTSACITNLSGSAAGSPLFASITNSPSVVVSSGSSVITSGSVIVNTTIASPLLARLTDGTDMVAVDAASRLLVSASLTDGLTVTSASVTVVNNGTASPIYSRLTDGTDNVAVDSASRLLVSASLTDGLSVTAASVTIVNNSTACVLYTSACITNLAGSAAGSPLFASITNSPSVVVSSGSVVVTNALSASISNTVTVAQGASGASSWGVKVLDSDGNAFGYGVASPLYARVVSGAGSAAGSPLFVLATNATGSAAGSPIFSSITNLSGSAAGSPLFVLVNNLTGSATGCPTFTSITNLGGSAAGSPLFVSACLTNLAGSAAGSPLFVRVGDGTDTAFVDSACRLAVTITDGANAYGLPGSPLSQAGQGQTMWWAGSMLTISQIDLSSSISGCTLIVASATGIAIVIVNATFTTSGCQRIGWTACGNNGGASATIQTPMPFGTNGGMDAKRSPDSYLWAFPSGSKAVLTTTSACYVAGTINYISVAS